MGNISG